MTNFVAFGNEELDKAPRIEDGTEILCPLCLGTHKIEFTHSEDSAFTLGTYRCGDKIYLAAVNGKLILGLKGAK